MRRAWHWSLGIFVLGACLRSFASNPSSAWQEHSPAKHRSRSRFAKCHALLRQTLRQCSPPQSAVPPLRSSVDSRYSSVNSWVKLLRDPSLRRGGRAFMWLCAIGLNISPAQAGATPAAVLRMVRGGSQKPGCCRGSGQVIRSRAAPARQQRSRARAKQFSLPARACAADAAQVCGSTLFLPIRLRTETKCRRVQEPQRGRASPSPGALLLLSVLLSIRLGN